MPLSDADSARALDAWLKEHLGSADRRAAVRGVADRLEDLQGCEYDELDEALELSTWPNLTRKRFVAAWRRLKADAAPMDDFDELYSEVAGAPASVTPDPPRAAPTRVAPPPPLSPFSNVPSTADESDDDAWEAGARALLDEIRDARARDSRVGLEGLRSALTRHGFGMARVGNTTAKCALGRLHIAVPATFPVASAKIRSLPDLVRYLQRALGDDAKAPAWATAEPAASEYATTGDAELARRLAMGLPPRRASRGPSPPPAPAPSRLSPDASDAEAEESSDDDDVPLSQWQAKAAAAPWAVGDKVEAKFCVKSGQRSKYSRDFYPATITAIHGDTVDVDYDTSDEETEERLPVRHVRKRRRAPAAPPPAAAPPPKKKKKAPTKTAHAPGDERSRLMAQCLKRGILCQGSATTMEYMQQKLAAYAGPEPADDLRVGGACFCRWGDKWYGAKILSVDGESYRVHFLGWGKRYDSDCAAEDVRPAR